MSEEFTIGDRVKLTGLQGAAHLNGRYGTVATEWNEGGRHAVHLELLKDPTVVNARPANLQRVTAAIIMGVVEDRASVRDGVLELQQGWNIAPLLSLVRFVVLNVVRGERRTTYDQVAYLPFSQAVSLMEYALDHWKEEVYDLYRDYIQNQFYMYSPEDRAMALAALESPRAMKSWNVYIHTEFWFVARDWEGSYIVPVDNLKSVYKVVGLIKTGRPAFTTPSASPTFMSKPHKLEIFVLPWHGRLIYDAQMLPPEEQVESASAKKASRLHDSVLDAIENDSVIEYFSEVEFGNE